MRHLLPLLIALILLCACTGTPLASPTSPALVPTATPLPPRPTIAELGAPTATPTLRVFPTGGAMNDAIPVTPSPPPTPNLAPTQTRAAELAQIATLTAPTATAPATFTPTARGAPIAPLPTQTPAIVSAAAMIGRFQSAGLDVRPSSAQAYSAVLATGPRDAQVFNASGQIAVIADYGDPAAASIARGRINPSTWYVVQRDNLLMVWLAMGQAGQPWLPYTQVFLSAR